MPKPASQRPQPPPTPASPIPGSDKDVPMDSLSIAEMVEDVNACQDLATIQLPPTLGEFQVAYSKRMLSAIDGAEFFIDRTAHFSHGAMIKFLCLNLPTGGLDEVGIYRTQVTKPAHIPEFLVRHHQTIKLIGLHFALANFEECYWPFGAGESLTSEDFTLSFTCGSLSPYGLAHNHGRHEASVGYFMMSNMIEPVDFGIEGTPPCHLILAYIKLNEVTRRRYEMVKRRHEELEREQQRDVAAPTAPGSKRRPPAPPTSGNSKQPKGNPPPPTQLSESFQRRMDQKTFPSLPTVPNLQVTTTWRRDGRPSLPSFD